MGLALAGAALGALACAAATGAVAAVLRAAAARGASALLRAQGNLRFWLGPAVGLEQLIRAEALSERGFFRTIHPDDLTPARLIAEIDDLLGRVNGDAGDVNLNGLPAAAAELEAALYDVTRSARTGTTAR